MRQLYYEDVNVGEQITPIVKIATTRMLVKWAGATGDFHPTHYDDAYARAQGLGGPIVHGALKCAWLAQLMTDWIGVEGNLKRLKCRYLIPDYPRKMLSATDRPAENGAPVIASSAATAMFVAGVKCCTRLASAPPCCSMRTAQMRSNSGKLML